MAVDPTQTPRRDGKKNFDYEFGEYLFANQVAKIFG
jgi:hypothetical protein